MKFKIMVLVLVLIFSSTMIGCDTTQAVVQDSRTDTQKTIDLANKLQGNQPTPDGLEFSLERYNLRRRAYWVNGQREEANALVCEIEKPLGYIVLVTENGGILGKFMVDGKVSSLNSYLTPDSEYYELVAGSQYGYDYKNKWLADVDGSYGYNDDGIFFFTVNGNYVEWSGTYLYSDIPMEISDPIIKFQEVK